MIAEIGDPVDPVTVREHEPVGAGAAGEPVVALAADEQIAVAPVAAPDLVIPLAPPKSFP